MVAEDFLQDPQVPQWLDGVEPAWTVLTFDSLRALSFLKPGCTISSMSHKEFASAHFG